MDSLIDVAFYDAFRATCTTFYTLDAARVRGTILRQTAKV